MLAVWCMVKLHNKNGKAHLTTRTVIPGNSKHALAEHGSHVCLRSLVIIITIRCFILRHAAYKAGRSRPPHYNFFKGVQPR